MRALSPICGPSCSDANKLITINHNQPNQRVLLLPLGEETARLHPYRAETEGKHADTGEDGKCVKLNPFSRFIILWGNLFQPACLFVSPFPMGL